jgi:hypothetical protein
MPISFNIVHASTKDWCQTVSVVKTPAEEANRWKKVGETRVSGYKSAEFSKQMSCWTGAFRLAGQDKEAQW